VAAILAGSAAEADLDALEARLGEMLAAVVAATGVEGDPIATATVIREEAAAVFRDATSVGPRTTVGGDLPGGPLTAEDRAALLGYLVLARLGALAPGADIAATSRAWYDELRLAPTMEAGLRAAGLDEGAARSAVETVAALLALPRPSQIRGRGRARDLRLLDQWLAREPVRAALGVNTWEDTEWLDRDRLAALLAWAARLDAIETGSSPDTALADRLLAAARTAEYRVDRMRAALSGAAVKPRVKPKPRPTPKSGPATARRRR
jgi:hypothetical protein